MSLTKKRSTPKPPLMTSLNPRRMRHRWILPTRDRTKRSRRSRILFPKNRWDRNIWSTLMARKTRMFLQMRTSLKGCRESSLRSDMCIICPCPRILRSPFPYWRKNCDADRFQLSSTQLDTRQEAHHPDLVLAHSFGYGLQLGHLRVCSTTSQWRFRCRYGSRNTGYITDTYWLCRRSASLGSMCLRSPRLGISR